LDFAGMVSTARAFATNSVVIAASCSSQRVLLRSASTGLWQMPRIAVESNLLGPQVVSHVLVAPVA
jgi:hypothetical protein